MICGLSCHYMFLPLTTGPPSSLIRRWLLLSFTQETSLITTKWIFCRLFTQIFCFAPCHTQFKWKWNITRMNTSHKSSCIEHELDGHHDHYDCLCYRRSHSIPPLGVYPRLSPPLKILSAWIVTVTNIALWEPRLIPHACSLEAFSNLSLLL